MPSTLRQQSLLVLAAGLIFFVNLGAAELWDDDEPKNAQCAREMLARGDWVVPTFNGELRPDKPVLVYWLMMSAYQTFGDNEFAARFWSAVAAIGTTLATYHIGRTLFGPRVGLWSGWIMATSLMFVIAGRAATPDSLTILCTTLAMLAFVRATWGASGTLAGADRLADFLPRSRSGMAAVYSCMAFGVLAKGPVALLLPTLVLLVYLVAVRQRLNESGSPSFLLRCARLASPTAWCPAGWKLRPFTAVVMLALIALPWYATVGFTTDGEWLSGFLGQHNVGRFLSTMEGHRGPFCYYAAAIAFGFFPWTVLLPEALAHAVQRAHAAKGVRNLFRRTAFPGGPGLLKKVPDTVLSDWAAHVFLLCWAGVWTVFFSFSSTKLPSYVTPAYPALAIITAAWIESWLAAPEKVSRWIVRQSMVSLIVVGIALTAALPVIAAYLLPGEEVLAIVGLILVMGGSLGLWWAVRRPNRAAAALVVTSLAFITSLFGFAAVRVSRHQNSAATIRGLQAGGQHPPLAAFDFAVPGLVYYAHDRVPQIKYAEQAIGHLRSSPEAKIITYSRGYEELRPLLPAGVGVVRRERRFLRRSEVIVLGHVPGPTHRTARAP